MPVFLEIRNWVFTRTKATEGGKNSVDPALAHTSCSSSSFPESEQDDELSEVRSFESESVPLS